MLQQTQVATVIPYFERFTARFPSVDRLASASQDEVLHQWTGLGYYARARNLHKSAQILMTEFNGELPMDQAQLERLPGIGRSTAAAIVSTCADKPAAILDGNVKRVLARIYKIEGWPGQSQVANALWDKAEALTPESRNADYTQAIMDLGALVCTRSKPGCDVCPFETSCLAKIEDLIDQLPGRKPKKDKPVKTTTMYIVRCGTEFLLEKRPATGIWAGLWSFPEKIDHLDISIQNQTSLDAFRHTFTHYHLDIEPVLIETLDQRVIREPGYLWYSLEDPEEIGLTKPVTKILGSLVQA